MESTNLTTRTYTAPTCSLVVTTKAPLLPNLIQLNKPQAVDFTLHLGHPEQAESERLVLKGDPLQLTKLHQSVSKYVADLVAKFPIPTTDSHNPAAAPANPSGSSEQSVDRQLDPNPAGNNARGSGLSQNLPGLRIGSKQSAQSTPANPVDVSDSPLSTKNISKLLGLGNAANRVSDVAPKANPAETTPQTPPTPYLTGGDRSLDHKLHLGNLATSNSGEVLTLSAIQLFDLATTLDEYAAEVGAPKSIASTAIAEAAAREPEVSSGVTGGKPFDPTAVKPVAPKTETAPAGIGASNRVNPKLAAPVAPLNTPPSRLPDLPQAPAPRTTSQVYDYAKGGSRPAFLSVIPWAAAAALAVGVPLLLFGSKSNSLKELTSNVKLPENVKLPAFKAPDFEAAKQSVMSRLPKQEASTSADPNDLATNPGATAATNPKPWEQQPIQPPQTPPGAKMPGAQMPTSPDKIGIAPLPPTIMDSVGQVPAKAPSAKPAVPTQAAGVTATAKPATTGLTDIAPNPLSSPSLPPQLSSPIASQPAQPKPISVATATKQTQSKISNPVTTLPVTPAKIATAPKIVKSKVTNIQPGKISIAKQPIAMPPDLTAGTINPAPINTKIPFSSPEIQVAERVNPRPVQPAVKKKVAKAKVKPKAVAITPKSKTPKPAILTPEPVLEPFNPSPNPNLINPIPPTSGEGTNTQPNSPAFPEQQSQPNIGRNPNTTDPFDSPSLKETKRYFQGKWQADPNQPNSLQYVVRVSGKSGVVQTVSPQGEPATEYLKKTKLVKPGDKLISPAAAGRSDQKIRVVLQPDGTVDAFGEP
jgi:Domain of unknown function (DUF4335)